MASSDMDALATCVKLLRIFVPVTPMGSPAGPLIFHPDPNNNTEPVVVNLRPGHNVIYMHWDNSASPKTSAAEESRNQHTKEDKGRNEPMQDAQGGYHCEGHMRDICESPQQRGGEGPMNDSCQGQMHDHQDSQESKGHVVGSFSGQLQGFQDVLEGIPKHLGNPAPDLEKITADDFCQGQVQHCQDSMEDQSQMYGSCQGQLQCYQDSCQGQGQVQETFQNQWQCHQDSFEGQGQVHGPSQGQWQCYQDSFEGQGHMQESFQGQLQCQQGQVHDSLQDQMHQGFWNSQDHFLDSFQDKVEGRHLFEDEGNGITDVKNASTISFHPAKGHSCMQVSLEDQIQRQQSGQGCLQGLGHLTTQAAHELLQNDAPDRADMSDNDPGGQLARASSGNDTVTELANAVSQADSMTVPAEDAEQSDLIQFACAFLQKVLMTQSADAELQSDSLTQSGGMTSSSFAQNGAVSQSAHLLSQNNSRDSFATSVRPYSLQICTDASVQICKEYEHTEFQDCTENEQTVGESYCSEQKESSTEHEDTPCTQKGLSQKGQTGTERQPSLGTGSGNCDLDRKTRNLKTRHESKTRRVNTAATTSSNSEPSCKVRKMDESGRRSQPKRRNTKQKKMPSHRSRHSVASPSVTLQNSVTDMKRAEPDPQSRASVEHVCNRNVKHQTREHPKLIPGKAGDENIRYKYTKRKNLNSAQENAVGLNSDGSKTLKISNLDERLYTEVASAAAEKRTKMAGYSTSALENLTGLKKGGHKKSKGENLDEKLCTTGAGAAETKTKTIPVRCGECLLQFSSAAVLAKHVVTHQGGHNPKETALTSDTEQGLEDLPKN